MFNKRSQHVDVDVVEPLTKLKNFVTLMHQDANVYRVWEAAMMVAIVSIVPTHMGRKIVKLQINLNGRERGITTPQSLHWNLCKKKGEPLAPAKWTDYEHFILQQIVDIVVDDDSNPDYNKIHKLFLNVLSYKNSNINLPHLPLTVIKTKVNYILRDRTVFMTTLQQELSSNWL